MKPKQAQLRPANLLLEKHLDELGLRFRTEVKFCDGRKWRFDYLIAPTLVQRSHWPTHVGVIAVEIEGSVYTHGRHTRGKGFEADCEKYNWATRLGYTVLRFSTGQVLRGEAKKFLQEWVNK